MQAAKKKRIPLSGPDRLHSFQFLRAVFEVRRRGGGCHRVLALLIGSDRSTEPFIIIFYSKLRQGTLLYFGNGHRKFAGSICRNSLRAWSGRLLAKAQIFLIRSMRWLPP